MSKRFANVDKDLGLPFNERHESDSQLFNATAESHHPASDRPGMVRVD